MYYLIRRTLESGLINIIDKQRHFMSGVVELSFIFIVLTDNGKIFIDNLSMD